MIKILKQPEGSIEVKRFYLDEAKIIIVCPNCKSEREYDDYLSYPKINEFMKKSFYCHECDCEWQEEIKLNLTIEVKEKSNG